MLIVTRAAAAAASLSFFLAGAALAQGNAPQPRHEKLDRTEKVCENITLTGSRLATKRFCGTRAEWEERRQRDREEVERAQRSPCVVNGTTCK